MCAWLPTASKLPFSAPDPDDTERIAKDPTDQGPVAQDPVDKERLELVMQHSQRASRATCREKSPW
eukprot:CAMPEP_0172604560 /NCGR_PEP_ID=MMETSP1068-20121228/24813_1 /TAXON_ID=35684 /ORGANISM="Pseudopedinella elastica, Strain CCMP716" /LENGTH=65 /DNA_ID=CAMNT_0013406669 /DNA_START=50 /DNA_END=247 /DNA_ORIENTATION=+